MGADADNLAREVEPLLRGRIGLNPETLGAAHILHYVRQRMAARRAADVSAYAHLLQAEEEEFEELVARLVVPESWFFRDLQPFRCLQHYVREHWCPGPPVGPLRVLSVPCSTGEEPYSMAMTLLGLGLGPGQLQVDGVDLSRAVLGKAAVAAYEGLSFRERDEDFAQLCRRYSEPDGVRTVVRDEVRFVVRFRQGNLVAPEFLAGEPPYRVIFCRNLFIYLEPRARAAALANLCRLLVPDGLLYVGHVEASAVAGDLFRPFHPAFPFAFQPGSGKGLPQAGDASPSNVPGRERAPVKRARLTAARTGPKSSEESKAKVGREGGDVPSKPTRPSLAEARRAADNGNLGHAAAECAELLRTDPANAAAHCLLGVIRQAQSDDATAERCFQRALYLDPRLHEALVHMALLAERRGQGELAANYRRRAGRAAGM